MSNQNTAVIAARIATAQSLINQASQALNSTQAAAADPLVACALLQDALDLLHKAGYNANKPTYRGSNSPNDSKSDLGNYRG